MNKNDAREAARRDAQQERPARELHDETPAVREHYAACYAEFSSQRFGALRAECQEKFRREAELHWDTKDGQWLD